jgi:hypothetical protein
LLQKNHQLLTGGANSHGNKTTPQTLLKASTGNFYSVKIERFFRWHAGCWMCEAKKSCGLLIAFI